MATTEIRTAVSSERAELVNLWHDVFSDPLPFIDTFFDTFSSAYSPLVLCCGSRPAAFAHILNFGAFVAPDTPPQPCAYIYAVAVAEAYRGRGYGKQITQAAVTAAKNVGFSLCALTPASEELFNFYSANFYPVFTCSEQHFSRLPDTTSVISQPIRLTPSSYSGYRESFLSNIPHIRFNLKYLTFLENTGMTYMSIDTGHFAAAAAVEASSVRLVIKELLPADSAPVLVPLLLRYFNVQDALVRTPGTQRKFAMLNTAVPDSAYLGFALD